MAELKSHEVLAKNRTEINELKKAVVGFQQIQIKTMEIKIPWSSQETEVTDEMKTVLKSLFNGKDWNILNVYYTPQYDWSRKTTAYYTLPLSEVYKMLDYNIADLHFTNDRHKWVISWEIQANKLVYKTIESTLADTETAAIIIHYI